MPIPPSLRALIPLVTGLAVGCAGAVLFMQSMPAPEGSPEERARKLEHDLKIAQARVSELEASPRRHERAGRSFADKARNIAEDIREGRPVSPDDVFRAAQPLLRDLAPLFDRMRVRGQQQMIDSMTGEYARKYHLNASQQEALKEWFRNKSDEEAKRWNDLVAKDGTSIEDMMRASQKIRPDQGLDGFMEKTLSGDDLTTFKTDRLKEKTNRVQQEADMQVQRLDSIVQLDDTQRNQVFGIMARGSKDYDPSMKLEGSDAGLPGGNRNEATLSILRPDQRAAYEAERTHRREEAKKDFEAMGLTLPPDWNLFDQNDF